MPRERASPFYLRPTGTAFHTAVSPYASASPIADLALLSTTSLRKIYQVYRSSRSDHRPQTSARPYLPCP
jgi:hypothetical protein